MINFNKLQGITDNVATAIKKAQSSMSTAFSQKPDAASAKKLAGSLDGLAAQNKAATKSELLKLGNLRQKLIKSHIQPEHLDNATLRKIEKEAEKIKSMNLDELQKHGCSPTDLPEIAAAKKLIENPYTNSQRALQQKTNQVSSWMNNRSIDTNQFNDKTINKIAKKTQEYEANMLKQAAKRGVAPTGDPLGAALKKVVPNYEPKAAQKVVKTAAADVPQAKTAEKLIDAGAGDVLSADNLKVLDKMVLEPRL